MSNPSVTATITADDKASPKLRELVELTQRLSKTAKAALSESAGGAYANSFRQASSAARQHLSVLERIHKVQSAIGATAAGLAGAKAFHLAKSAFLNYVPYERDVRYQRAIQNYGSADMALLERQRVYAAAVYGLKPEDTLHAQQAFVTRNFSAPITEAATKQAIILAKALNVKTDEAARIVEGLTFGQGIHLHSRTQAAREIARSADMAAIAAKAGAMSPEDLQAFGKYGIGMSTAAGIDAKQSFAAAMTLKRANVGGDESGVFMRQLSARLLAPTKQAFEAFAHMGINYADYAPQGSVSPEAIDASLRRRYGKGLSDAGKASLAGAFGDETRNVLGSREDFTAAVREAVEAGGEKLTKTDQKNLVATALRQYDLAKGSLNGGALFDAILSKASARDMQAIIGDKQGGRAVMLLNALDQYREYLEKLSHGDGYAEKIATERMQGLAAAVDRFSSSLDMAEKQAVQANAGWITPLVEAAARLTARFTDLSADQKQSFSLATGSAALAGIAAMAATATRAAAGMASLAVGVEGVTALLGTASLLSGGAAIAAFVAAAMAATQALYHIAGDNILPEGARHLTPQQIGRRRNLLNRSLNDIVNDSAPFDKYQPPVAPHLRGRTAGYLKQIGIDDAAGEGWQGSARVTVASPSANKWGDGGISKVADLTGVFARQDAILKQLATAHAATAQLDPLREVRAFDLPRGVIPQQDQPRQPLPADLTGVFARQDAILKQLATAHAATAQLDPLREVRAFDLPRGVIPQQDQPRQPLPADLTGVFARQDAILKQLGATDTPRNDDLRGDTKPGDFRNVIQDLLNRLDASHKSKGLNEAPGDDRPLEAGIQTVIKPGDSKDLAVSGTVTGEAELHQNFQFEIRPTAYFEALVKRAESVANIQLNGNLGTGLHGPGDNSVKPSVAPTGTQ